MTQEIEVWRMSRDAYQVQKGVHRPWIGEISTMQFAGLSKRGRAQYEQKRDREWQASADCALAYARECFEAFELNPSILDSQDMHPDARSAIFSMRQAQRKEAFEQLFALARLQNNLTSTADVEIGDRVYSILHGVYVTIIKKHKVSVRVRDDSGDEFKVKIGACQWLHYNELKAAVEAGQPVRPVRVKYRIERLDGSIDGLGDVVLFESEAAAWEAAQEAFGADPASDEGGITAWLRVVEASRQNVNQSSV